MKTISVLKFKQFFLFCILFIVVCPALAASDNCTAVYGTGANTFRLATGSPGELGLLKVLANAYNKSHKTSLCWKKAGSGASLLLLKKKKVDMIMVHAPAAEKKAVKEGWAVKRTLIGSNEFYIVGPKSDPAGIAGSETATEAFSRIASAESLLFSRGDNSGTHKKELAVWKKAGICPSGYWYIKTNSFMMATLKRANSEEGYFMTDSSTWVAGKKDLNNLKLLLRGDPMLINTYHALCQPEGATSGQAFSEEFIDFLASDEGQNIIRNYGIDLYGGPLYNDAEYAVKYDH